MQAVDVDEVQRLFEQFRNVDTRSTEKQVEAGPELGIRFVNQGADLLFLCIVDVVRHVDAVDLRPFVVGVAGDEHRSRRQPGRDTDLQHRSRFEMFYQSHGVVQRQDALVARHPRRFPRQVSAAFGTGEIQVVPRLMFVESGRRAGLRWTDTLVMRLSAGRRLLASRPGRHHRPQFAYPRMELFRELRDDVEILVGHPVPACRIGDESVPELVLRDVRKPEPVEISHMGTADHRDQTEQQILHELGRTRHSVHRRLVAQDQAEVRGLVCSGELRFPEVADRWRMDHGEVLDPALDRNVVVRQKPEFDLPAGRFGERQHRVEVLPLLDAAAVQHRRMTAGGGRVAGGSGSGGQGRDHRNGQPSWPERRILLRVMLCHGLAYADTAPGALEDVPFDGFIPCPKMDVSQHLFFFGGDSVDVDEYLARLQPRQYVFGQMQRMDVECIDVLRQIGYEGDAVLPRGVEEHLGTFRVVPDYVAP